MLFHKGILQSQMKRRASNGNGHGTGNFEGILQSHTGMQKRTSNGKGKGSFGVWCHKGPPR